MGVTKTLIQEQHREIENAQQLEPSCLCHRHCVFECASNWNNEESHMSTRALPSKVVKEQQTDTELSCRRYRQNSSIAQRTDIIL
eukprot:708889-Amphidinium_carterae.4